MDAVRYEVRSDSEAFFHTYRGAAFYSRMPVTCWECDARTGLTLTAQGEDTRITCPQGHMTRDGRLSPEAVRDVVRVAVEAGVDVVPADAEIELRVVPKPQVLPELEDMTHIP
ncbi:hypothetical protein ACSCBZ_46415 [Streptomyces niveiscabiei]|uniref:hypothetical protein n=1 Tax=Streptomyces niveiscabiei TaxID=164115 RepID=UPI0006EB91DB|nr:hypothetical protein [Streptomyces niveiscabiei]